MTVSPSFRLTAVKWWFGGHLPAVVEVGGAICSVGSQPPGYFLDGQKLLVRKNPRIPNCISQHERGKICAVHHVDVSALWSRKQEEEKQYRYLRRRKEPSAYESRLPRQIILLTLVPGRASELEPEQSGRCRKALAGEDTHLLRESGEPSIEREIRCNWCLFSLTDNLYYNLTFLHDSLVYRGFSNMILFQHF